MRSQSPRHGDSTGEIALEPSGLGKFQTLTELLPRLKSMSGQSQGCLILSANGDWLGTYSARACPRLQTPRVRTGEMGTGTLRRLREPVPISPVLTRTKRPWVNPCMRSHSRFGRLLFRVHWLTRGGAPTRPPDPRGEAPESSGSRAEPTFLDSSKPESPGNIFGFPGRSGPERGSYRRVL
jgi:hypothetical protein